jgi:hypothetical protein
LLGQKGDWTSAEEAATALDIDERNVRRLANESRGHIFSGAHGYKQTVSATQDDIKEVNRLKTQAIKMMARYKEIKNVWDTKRDFKEDFRISETDSH